MADECRQHYKYATTGTLPGAQAVRKRGGGEGRSNDSKSSGSSKSGAETTKRG